MPQSCSPVGILQEILALVTREEQTDSRLIPNYTNFSLGVRAFLSVVTGEANSLMLCSFPSLLGDLVTFKY